MSQHWSIHQLTSYLSEISGQEDEPRATELAAERAAESLDAEVAAVCVGDVVVASVGFGHAGPPAGLVALARATGTVAVPGLGDLHAAVGDVDRDAGEVLLVGRRDEPVQAEELQMLHGMAQMLGLALRGIRTLQAARERQRLVETLLAIQRSISGRRPLPEVLDAVTAGASGLFGGLGVSLVLIESAGPDGHLVASTHGRRHRGDAEVLAAGSAATAGGRTVVAAGGGRVGDDAGRVLVAAPVLVEGEVAGALVADLPADADPAGRPTELLAAFAQQISLALTDARTMAAIRESFRDPLTGLSNRALFMERLDRAFTQVPVADADLAVVYIDLDGFKAVNDTYGHGAGDELLRVVAERISACVREGDTVARLGGDEFALLLPQADEELAVGIAERVITVLRQPFAIGEREMFVAASAGVAQRRPGCAGPAELLGSGDVAMYQAKQSGRGRVVVFEPAMQARHQRRAALQNDLRGARDFEGFSLQYQPIVHLPSGTPVGVEALVRWAHPERGLISPAHFIPIAEESGVIRDLGRWVLARSAEQVTAWRDVVPDLHLNVNVSARQLGGSRFPDDLREVLARTGLPGGALTIEMTETALMTDPESTQRHLEEVRELGVGVCLDDFGTGYSSLSYLRRFPVDEVKIDRSFVRDVPRSAEDLALVRAVVDLAAALRLRTVAEGIEDADQLAVLLGLGCPYGQGYLLAPPLDAGLVPAFFTPLTAEALTARG